MGEIPYKVNTISVSIKGIELFGREVRIDLDKLATENHSIEYDADASFQCAYIKKSCNGHKISVHIYNSGSLLCSGCKTFEEVDAELIIAKALTEKYILT